MFNLLIPVAAVVFSFIVGVLNDIQTAHKLDFSKLTTLATKTAMYLAAIGMLEVVAKQDATLAPEVVKFALGFGIAEVVGTLGMIKQASSGAGTTTTPADTAINTLENELTTGPFDVLKK